MSLHPPRPAVLLRAAPPAWLYGLVVFAGAWLVFWIQPLAVRGVLPVLGGSPAVWNTAMVFFQSALLAGYALAHLLVRRASPAGQLAVLAALWAGVALAAPVGGLRLLGEAPSQSSARPVAARNAGRRARARCRRGLVPDSPRPGLARACRRRRCVRRSVLPLLGLERRFGRGSPCVSVPPRAFPGLEPSGVGLERGPARARSLPPRPVDGLGARPRSVARRGLGSFRHSGRAAGGAHPPLPSRFRGNDRGQDSRAVRLRSPVLSGAWPKRRDGYQITCTI